jgi:hypothetical protein
LPDPLVRVKRNVSNVLRRERIPSDSDTCTAFGVAGAEKIGLLKPPGAAENRSTAGTADSRSRPRPCQPSVNLRRAGNYDNPLPGGRIPDLSGSSVRRQILAGVRVTVRFVRDRYRVGTSRNGTGGGAIPKPVDRDLGVIDGFGGLIDESLGLVDDSIRLIDDSVRLIDNSVRLIDDAGIRGAIGAL